MDDCISRQRAVDELHKGIFDLFDFFDDDEESPITYKDEVLLEVNKAITERIRKLPVREVVLCKDCKHRDVENGFCKGRGWPMQLVPDDGFCDKGKGSENDG